MKSLLKRCALVVVVVAVAAGFNGEVRAQYSRTTPIVEAVKKVRDSIVTLKVTRSSYDSNLVGTGVIVDERGYLITNYHVVADQRKIQATLRDGTVLAAKVYKEDPDHDLAILRISTKNKLKALSFGPGTDLMVGETVIAIGNPHGYTNTVSTGIISALGREIDMPAGARLTNLIQTNASINPGNSGGPLVNINGELIGINVALRQDAQGIAFALNAETVKSVLSKHLSSARVSKVRHGLTCVERVEGEEVKGEDKERQKVVVEAVSSEKSGLKKGDVLVQLGGLKVRNRFDVERALWGYKAGEKAEVVVERDGKKTTVSLTLGGGETRVTSAGSRDR